MKDFFKFMFASMLGFIITLVVLFLFFIAMVASFISFADKEEVEVKENSILYLELDYPIYDRTQSSPFTAFASPFDMKPTLGLNDMIKNLDKAARDENIKGIYLDLDIYMGELAITEELRAALQEFKSSGKFIVCNSESYSQLAYYLGSVADKVYLHPLGMLEFKGIGAELMFLKGTLEKLDIDPQVIRHGKYKSAIEPLILDEMSESNEEQINAFITSLWETMVSDISESRNIPVDKLNQIADNLEALNADNALDLMLIDDLYYYDQVKDELKQRLALTEDEKINMISIVKYDNAPDPDKKRLAKDKIAVVYASGSIGGGEGDDLSIGSERISKAIRKARKDEKVKAIVFRVNSPGGSALASEVIRREVELASQVKPVIVSMSDLAASGGYWISCSADRILADRMTLTGSIGVFGVIPNMQGFFNNKLGITFDETMTNRNADFPTVTKPMPEYQMKMLEKEIDMIYQDFIKLVAEGRDMSTEAVDEVGQGRVWAAPAALDAGLVDELGGLTRAVELAAEMAELTEYRLYELPVQKDPIEQILEGLKGEARSILIGEDLGSYYRHYQYIEGLQEMKGVQARLPFFISVD